MNKTHALAAIALSLTLATGCSRAESHAPRATSPEVAAAAAPAIDPANGSANAEAPPASDRALIVTGEIHLRAADVAGAAARVRSEAERAGGYVSSSNESGDTSSRSAAIEVRVPRGETGRLRAVLAGLGEITSDVEKVEDVTEARADLQARLTNARAEEARVLAIMQRTGTISDVLKTEEELARVRETIERLEAQERTMQGQIALAKIEVHIDAPPAAVAQAEPEAWKTPVKSIGAAFGAGLRGAAALTVYAAMAFAAIAPVVVPLGLVLSVALGLARRRRRLLEAAN